MYPDFNIYLTNKGTVFLADGDTDVLIPLKKGTPETVYYKGGSIYYGCIAFEMTEYFIVHCKFKHTIYKTEGIATLENIRTTEDKRIKVRGYSEYVHRVDEDTVETIELFNISNPYSDEFKFLRAWVYDEEVEQEYLYSDGSLLSTVGKAISAYTRHTQALPEYQLAPLHNLAFKLYDSFQY